MRRVPGTDLDEIRVEEERFAALVERELSYVVRRVTGSIGEVVVARGSTAAATPDDLNGMIPLWQQRVSNAIMPALQRIVSASVRGQIAGLNTAMSAPIIRSFDEELITRLLLQGAENRMVGVGNQLWQNARSALAEGVASGQSIPDIARAVRESAAITAPRATTVARTEVIAASNKSSIEVMRAAGLVAQKRWIATFDNRVRLSHIDAHDQVVPLDDMFDIGGAQLAHPGDYSGPPEEVINCRCAMGYIVDEDSEDSALTAATEHNHNGAMIALVPTEDDVKRLALELDGAESADELHMTMVFLGDADAWNSKQREALINALSTYDWDHEGDTGTLTCNAFGLAHWNPHSDTPCWVLNIGGDDIANARSAIDMQLSRLSGEVPLPEVPAQHAPFAAHMCLAYTSDTSQELINQLKKRMGDVAFDRVRVAFAGEYTDIPLRDTLSTKASATPAASEANVDWFIEKAHEECTDERPWAVVKASDGAVEGCHETREDAVSQMRALLEAQARERVPEVEPVDELTTVDTREFQVDGEPNESMRIQFEGVAVVEGERTGDGRQFAPGALTWPDLAQVNVPLQWQKETSHGGINDVTVNVGKLTELVRSGQSIIVRGYIDSGSEDGAEVVRRMRAGTAGGVSIVADDPESAEVEYVYPDGCEDLENKTIEEIDEMPMEELNRCMMPEYVVFHSGRIRALTLVDTPAFVEASISLVEDGQSNEIEDSAATVTSQEFGTVKTAKIDDFGYRRLSELDITDPTSVAQLIDEIEPLLAAAHVITIPDVPPAAWFDEPTDLPPYGALHVTDDGRVYGLLAPRSVAHRSYPDKRVTVPMGNVDYSRWMNRETIVQGGQRIATGPITMDCGHASTSPILSAPESMDHYENACSVVATVRIGENARGVWVAGALMQGVTPGQVARMLACQLSGDWRKHREAPGKRELVGALLVPVPGFPTASPRQQLRLDHGELVASSVPVSWHVTDNEVFNVDPVPAETPPIEDEPVSTVDTGESTVDAPESDVDTSVSDDGDLPSWEDIQKRRELREQSDALATRLRDELGIEIGV